MRPTALFHIKRTARLGWYVAIEWSYTRNYSIDTTLVHDNKLNCSQKEFEQQREDSKHLEE